MANEQSYIGCLQELAEKAELIRGAIEEEAWDRMVVCLEERQELMNRIDRMQQKNMRLSEEERVRARSLLEQVTAQDREITARLAVAVESTRGAMKEQDLARKTMNAYRKTARPMDHEMRARFIDKQQ